MHLQGTKNSRVEALRIYSCLWEYSNFPWVRLVVFVVDIELLELNWEFYWQRYKEHNSQVLRFLQSNPKQKKKSRKMLESLVKIAIRNKHKKKKSVCFFQDNVRYHFTVPAMITIQKFKWTILLIRL